MFPSSPLVDLEELIHICRRTFILHCALKKMSHCIISSMIKSLFFVQLHCATSVLFVDTGAVLVAAIAQPSSHDSW